LKASDSKSDRGASPSGVQILSPPPKFLSKAFGGDSAEGRAVDARRRRVGLVGRGGRVAEGAALEMPCRGNSTVGSNPTPSAIYPQHGEAMLTVGENVTSFVFAQSAVAVLL